MANEETRDTIIPGIKALRNFLLKELFEGKYLPGLTFFNPLPDEISFSVEVRLAYTSIKLTSFDGFSATKLHTRCSCTQTTPIH